MEMELWFQQMLEESESKDRGRSQMVKEGVKFDDRKEKELKHEKVMELKHEIGMEMVMEELIGEET